MRWYEATVYENRPIGVDDTRNTRYSLGKTGTKLLVRTAPMAPRREDVEGNRFDVAERTFLTKCASSLLEDAAAVEVRGVLYELQEVSSWNEQGGVVALRVKRFK